MRERDKIGFGEAENRRRHRRLMQPMSDLQSPISCRVGDAVGGTILLVGDQQRTIHASA
jgi:hypothetical protein